MRNLHQTKVIFAKYGLPQKLMSDAGADFVSDKLQQFCRSINVDQAMSLVYHHQSTRQVEACIKFVKCTLKCADSGGDINIAL